MPAPLRVASVLLPVTWCNGALHRACFEGSSSACSQLRKQRLYTDTSDSLSEKTSCQHTAGYS
jgi:hypothetical protein